MRQPHSQDTAEMRLLIRDLLLDKAVYEGIGMEVFRQRGIWPETLVQRIHQRSIEAGLDEIEDCFVLGLIPEPMNRDYMEALNARYADMARSGDLSGLQNLCEPIVRSGEITLQYNPSLLLEVLDNGHIELYQYMLELVDRTRDLSMELLDSQLSVMDITFDPFHVAIRLGQKDLVKALVGQGEFFEGRITWPDSTQILTPLSSAVFWRQADIVRLLLHSGPVYRSGYPQAVSLALSAEMDDMLQVLTSYDLVSVPSSLPTVSVSSPTGLSPAIASTPEAPTLVSEESSPIISGIANSFAGLDIEMPIAPTQSPPWEAIDPVLLQYPPAQGQANVPAMIPTHDNPPSAPPPVEPPMPVPENPSPSTTPEDHHPYVRQRPLHKARRKLGQGFIQRLGVLRTKMGQACAEDAAIQPLAHHFRSLEAIWEGGIEVFRNITRNKVPSGLVQVLHCLMVADALSSHANPDQDLKTQFTNDLGRWRAIFQEPDRNLYDIVAGHLWGYNTDSDPHIPTCSCDQVYQFQELIQNLVSLDRIDDQLHRASKLSGVGLRHIQRGIAQRARGVSPYFNQTRAALRQNQDFPSISHVLGQLTKDTDSGDTGDVDIGDFIHLEAIQEEDARQRRHEVPLAAHKPWKDISSMLVLLLASVAFSIILAVISGTYLPNPNKPCSPSLIMQS
ncbi:hypothetical protein B0I35DRAFT_82684 [Stachybotrys elegans]|uniref:Uncharacterized protein n=1 Tax=Stachybotrys elegans TaxID=80388 RepID=A0A8K0SHF6_9HYPO|nr:hypothetical protein B0I35DRAFT_82684 [Stachybotrys elegans]